MELGDALAGKIRQMGPLKPKANVDGDGQPIPFGITRDEIQELLAAQEEAEREDREERGEAA